MNTMKLVPRAKPIELQRANNFSGEWGPEQCRGFRSHIAQRWFMEAFSGFLHSASDIFLKGNIYFPCKFVVQRAISGKIKIYDVHGGEPVFVKSNACTNVFNRSCCESIATDEHRIKAREDWISDNHVGSLLNLKERLLIRIGSLGSSSTTVSSIDSISSYFKLKKCQGGIGKNDQEAENFKPEFKGLREQLACGLGFILLCYMEDGTLSSARRMGGASWRSWLASIASFMATFCFSNPLPSNRTASRNSLRSFLVRFTNWRVT